MSLDMSRSKIQEFYSGKTVLVTGGTGWLGKVLVEKLLYSCPYIRKVYLLVREKKGESGQQRLKSFWIKRCLFHRVRNSSSWMEEKLAVVSGDLLCPKLGLNENDVTILTLTVDVIIHTAATVRFHEGLKTSVPVNLGATKELCLLAKNMEQLIAFVYVSTAYALFDLGKLIPEKVHPCPLKPETLITLAEILPKDFLERITPSILGNKNNTYMLTKCASEEMVSDYGSCFPIAIFRPSTIGAPVSEPLPGYCDNLYTPTGVVAAASSGLLRTFHYGHDVQSYIVPVDYTANAIIALAYSLGQGQSPLSDYKDTGSVPLVNYVTAPSNPFPWNMFHQLLAEAIYKNPSSKHVIYPFCTAPRARWLYNIHNFVLHHLPARVVDGVTALLGRPTSPLSDYKDTGSVTLVNYVTAPSNPFPWNMFHQLLAEAIYENPSSKHVIYPFCTAPRARWLYNIHNFVLHHLPARVVDGVTALLGRPTSFTKIYEKMDKFTDYLNYFNTHHIEFEYKNTALLWESLEPMDRQLFPFNTAEVCWRSYMSDYVRGCRYYLLGESPDTLPGARRKLKRLYVVNMLIKASLVLYMLRVSGISEIGGSLSSFQTLT